MVRINLVIEGNEEDVLSFIGLCAKIELLGLWGASRTIPVDVDGDGSARLKFNATAKVGDEAVDLLQSWRDLNKGEFLVQINSKIRTHCIGE